MVFLIFTRTNLYLGINGRITELLMFDELPYLSLKSFSFPNDFDDMFYRVHREVEAYFDRTAFGMPSNIEVLMVYSTGVEDAIKRELTNEFESSLPAGWIWEKAIQLDTDHLDTEAREDLSIAFRRLIKNAKSKLGRPVYSSWAGREAGHIQVLEPEILPVVEKRPELTALIMNTNRKYLLAIPGVMMVGLFGFLLWPEEDTNGSRARNNNVNRTPVETIANNQYQPTKFITADTLATTKVDSANLVAEVLKDTLTGQLTVAAQKDSLRLIASAGREIAVERSPATFNNEPQRNSPINRSAEPNTEEVSNRREDNNDTKPVEVSSPPTNSEEGTMGIKTSNPTSAETTNNSSLSLSDYAQHSLEASFPGGAGSLKRFITLNTKFPKAAKRKNVRGEVIVKFDIDVEGRVVNPRIIKGLGYGCNDEAIRVVSSMPSWKPATQMRKRISSTHTVSVPFN